MIPDVLEHRLAEHCAPTLLGAKAASLLSLSREEFPELPEALRRYNRTLYRTGLRFLILRETSQRSLILVFRPALLRSRLNTAGAKALLQRFDYPETDCLGVLLRRLKKRFTPGGDFPHEIGLFLDYPPEDVEAFIAGSS